MSELEKQPLKWGGRGSNPRPTDYKSIPHVCPRSSKPHKHAGSDPIAKLSSQLEVDIGEPSVTISPRVRIASYCLRGDRVSP